MKLLLMFLLLSFFACEDENNNDIIDDDPIPDPYPNWVVYDTSNSNIPGNLIYRILEANNGDIWVTAIGEGVGRLSDSVWTVFRSELHSFMSLCLAQDSNDNMYLGHGYDNVLSMYQDGVWKLIQIPNSSRGVASVYVDNQEKLWIGLESVLLTHYDSTWITYTYDDSDLPGGYSIPWITQDKQDNIWVCSWKRFDGADYGGVARIADTTWTVYTEDNTGLPFGSAKCIAVDSQNNIWFGTSWDGLLKYDGSVWSQYDATDCPALNKYTEALDFDSQDNLWIGTGQGRLVKYDGLTWTVFDSTNSKLINSAITSLNVDRDDNVWIATYDAGLYKYSLPD